MNYLHHNPVCVPSNPGDLRDVSSDKINFVMKNAN